MNRITTPRFARRVVTLASALALLATALAAETKQKIQPLDRTVVAVTDYTDAGHELPVPTETNPVYFVGVNAGFLNYFGSAMAGDAQPPEPAMLKVITKVLADQHFVAATAAHPATQFIVVSWGNLGDSNEGGGPGKALAFLGGEKLDLMDEIPEVPGHIGAEVFKRRWRSGEAETVLDLSGRSLYAILIRAYDLQAAIEGRIIKLWETRLACPTPGTNLATALPQLVVSGRHVIGRETPQPVVRNVARTRDAWVEIPEGQVIEYIDATENSSAARAKRADPAPAPEKK